MAELLSVTLGISLVGLFSLLLLKRREMRTGRVIFARLRPKLRAFFHVALVVVEHVIPGILQHVWRSLVRFVRVGARRLAARAVVVLEQQLERLLHIVRSFAVVREQGGEVSAFLREVAAHKRALLKRAPSKRAIFEE